MDPLKSSIVIIKKMKRQSNTRLPKITIMLGNLAIIAFALDP